MKFIGNWKINSDIESGIIIQIICKQYFSGNILKAAPSWINISNS